MKRKVTKEEILNYLNDELMPQTDNDVFKNEIIKIMQELYDINNLTINPLTIDQTKILREYLGIYSNGERTTTPKLATIYNLSRVRISAIINKSLLLLKRRVLLSINSISNNKMSTIKDDDKLHKYQNKSVNELNITPMINYFLKRNNIYSINDLLMYGEFELIDMGLGYKSLELVKELLIKEDNLKLINSLNINEKREIINKYDIKTILNSSFEWFKSQNISLLKKICTVYKIKTLEDFQTLVNSIYINNELREELKNKLLELDLNCLIINKEEELTFERFLNFSIEELFINNYISYKNYKYLKLNKVYTLKGICLKTKDEIKNIIKFKYEVKEFINNMHNLGIFFKDEVEYIKEVDNNLVLKMK